MLQEKINFSSLKSLNHVVKTRMKAIVHTKHFHLIQFCLMQLFLHLPHFSHILYQWIKKSILHQGLIAGFVLLSPPCIAFILQIGVMAISMALFFIPLPSHQLWPGCILEYTVCQLRVKHEGEDRVVSIVFCLSRRAVLSCSRRVVAQGFGWCQLQNFSLGEWILEEMDISSYLNSCCLCFMKHSLGQFSAVQHHQQHLSPPASELGQRPPRFWIGLSKSLNCKCCLQTLSLREKWERCASGVSWQISLSIGNHAR